MDKLKAALQCALFALAGSAAGLAISKIVKAALQ